MEWRRWLSALPARFNAIARPRRQEQDLDEELSFHVAMQTHAEMQRGVSGDEANRRAHHALGGVEQTKERCRDARPLRWTQDLIQDVLYAVRSLRRSPGFTAVAVVTLALGIGANTALFSVISAVLLRPLAYPDAEQLVRVWTAQPRGGLPRSGSAMPDYRVWRSQNRTFEDLGAYAGATYAVTSTDRPELLVGTRMTASVWAVLKSQPLLGSVFSAAEEQWGAHRVVVISEGLWQRRFGGDPQTIGRAMELDGQSYVVVGVMPASFRFGILSEVWTPLAFAPGDAMDTRRNRWVDLLGRLKPGVALTSAYADLSTIAKSVERDTPENTGLGVDLAGWQESIVGPVRPMLWLLLGAVAFVLMIACANVANLLLARATTRQHELAVRVTLGAGLGRLIRQLLTEPRPLVVRCRARRGTGVWLDPHHSVTGPDRGAASERSHHGWNRGRFCRGVGSCDRADVWHLAGPVRGGRAGIMGHLKEGTRAAVGGQWRGRARHVLVIAEVSLSLVLLIGSALLIVSLKRVVEVDAGFQPDHLFTASLNLPPVRYGDAARTQAFVQHLVEQASALPGIRAIGTTTTLPLGGGEWGKYFSIEGQPVPPSLADVPNVKYRQVTPDYFRAIGASLRRGRWLSPQDGAGQPPVAVVSDTLARRFWPDGDPIGARISMNPPASLIPESIRLENLRRGLSAPPPLTIVGVIGDFRQNGLEREANPEVFVPLAQARNEFQSTFFVVARTIGDPLAATAPIQGVVNQFDRNLPLANVRTMDSRLSDSLAQRRFTMWLLGALAAVALAMAVVGLYGVLAYTVSQRHRELGVRAALGATAADSIRLVMAEGLRMTAVGVGVGLLLAAGLSRLMSTQLFHVRAIDPMVYGGVSLLLMIVASLACGLPALRATRVDPATALRCE